MNVQTWLTSRVVLAAIVGTAIAPVHAADTRGEVPQRIVNYSDAELQTSAGIARVYARIQHAAKEVCSPWESRDLHQQALHNKCVANAIDAAVANVHQPQLTQYRLARAGKTESTLPVS